MRHSLLACFFVIWLSVTRSARTRAKQKGTAAESKPRDASGLGWTVSHRYAIVSLLYGKDPPSVLNLRTTMSSARRHGLIADQLVMIPRGDAALQFRDLLETDGIQIVEVPGLSVPEAMTNGNKHWEKVFTKFMAFNLTMYEKVLLIDSDAFFTGGGNPNEIFRDCGAYEICLVEDTLPELFAKEDCPEDPALCRNLNTGVIVFTPSAERLHDIVVETQRDNHTYHLADQPFFSRYLRTRGVSFKLLDSTWNVCGHDPNVSSVEGRVWVGHFCQSWKLKDWRNYQHEFCTDDSNCSVTLRAWQSEALATDACLGQTQTACGAHRACGWCGTFCMDRRISCQDITFDQDKE